MLEKHQQLIIVALHLEHRTPKKIKKTDMEDEIF